MGYRMDVVLAGMKKTWVLYISIRALWVTPCIVNKLEFFERIFFFFSWPVGLNSGLKNIQ